MRRPVGAGDAPVRGTRVEANDASRAARRVEVEAKEAPLHGARLIMRAVRGAVGAPGEEPSPRPGEELSPRPGEEPSPRPAEEVALSALRRMVQTARRLVVLTGAG